MSVPITVTLSYHVRRGRASQFSVSATALLGTAAAQRGYLGAGVTGTASTGRDWQIFYRFEDEISLAAWEQSSAYARWIDYVEKFATRSDVQHAVGDEVSSVDPAPARPRQEQRVMAPAGRAPSRPEPAPRQDAPVDGTQVMNAGRLREAAQQRSGRHGRPEPAPHPVAAPVDATQVMDPRLRQAAQQQSGQYERPRAEADPETTPVNATQVMDAARLRELAQQRSGQQQSGQYERPQEVARHEDPPVNATQVMDAARLRELAQQRSGQYQQPRIERSQVEPPRVERPRVDRAQRASAQWEPDQWDAEFRELVAAESGWGPVPSANAPVPHSQPLPRPGTPQWDAAQREMAQWEAAKQETAQREAAEREAAQREMAQREAAEWEAAQREMAQREAAQREMAQREAAEREAAQREAALLEAAQRAVGNPQPVPQEESQWQQPSLRISRRESVDREPSRRLLWGRKQRSNRSEPDQASPARGRDSEQRSADPDQPLSPDAQRELFGDIEVPRPERDPLAVARGRRGR